MMDIRAHDPSALQRTPLAPRRMSLLLVGLIVLLVLVGARTLWLQSVRAETLGQFARGQQRYAQVLPAVRGDILDRHGQEMAVGEEAVTFYATPGLLEDRVDAAIEIAKLLRLTPAEERALVERLTTAEGGFVYVARQVTRDRAKVLIDAEIPGVGYHDEERRLYPNKQVAGQVIGAVDIDNRGIEGIEMLLDQTLSGAPGKQVVVTDPAGTSIDVLELKPETDGKDVQLTVDNRLQIELEGTLTREIRKGRAKGATGVVMNPRTGEIYALASVPGVDPNRFGKFPASARRMRAVTDAYEPGSTFKVVTISAAIEEGLVSPTTSFELPEEYKLCEDDPNCVISDSHDRPAQRLTTQQILQQSSNVGHAKIAQEYIGQERMDRWIRRYGFRSPTAVEFPGETIGLMPSLGEGEWTAPTLGNLAIGQGISVNALQLASAYAAIANDGVLVQPHLIKRVGDEPPVTYKRRRIISQRTARIMQTMFGGVVEDERGTGTAAKIDNYRVAGKTGTAEFVEGGVYAKGRYNSSFVGFVPARNPQLVTLIVYYDTPEYGGQIAAPSFTEVTKFALTYLAIPPDGVM